MAQRPETSPNGLKTFPIVELPHICEESSPNKKLRFFKSATWQNDYQTGHPDGPQEPL
jgi:hypothetical protein